MARLSLTILMATALTITTTTTAYIACKEGLDICGWALQNVGEYSLSHSPTPTNTTQATPPKP